MSKIYLSSTYEDLKDCRSAVYRALRSLRHDVISMEDYTAGDERPLDRCLRDVAACDAYVGVFAFRYGFVPVGEQASITELELREAELRGKPVLAFLLREAAPWPTLHVDADRGPILRLRRQLEAEREVDYFVAADELATKVSVAVSLLGLPGPDPHPGDADLARKASFLRSIIGGQIRAARYEERFYATISSALLALGVAIACAGALFVEWVVGITALIVPAAAVFPASTMISRHRRSTLLTDLAAELEIEPPSLLVLREVERLLDRWGLERR